MCWQGLLAFKKPFVGQQQQAMRSLFFALRHGLLLCEFLCVCVCFEKSFIGRQCAWGIESLMLVLMSQWKCLQSVIYKLHLPCLALPCFAPYCCLVRQRKWPKRDGKKTAVSFSCFSFLSLFLYISHVWYKMSQGILVD